MPKTRQPATPAPAPAPGWRSGNQTVDSGALPNDGQSTVSQPEPQREQATAQPEKPATGITPSGAAGGRRM